MSKIQANNVLGSDLQSCSTDPMTGFLRDGCCNTNHLDQGTHVVCAIVTDEFLQFSLRQGNDLITPRPEYDFPGLKAGDSWCLCALRWHEAYQAKVAPPIRLEATHENALHTIDLDVLKRHALQ